MPRTLDMRADGRDLMLRDEDRIMLEEIFANVADVEEEHRFNAPVFKRWLDDGYPLTAPQRTWLKDVHERVVGTCHYENLVSSGKVKSEKPGKEIRIDVGPKVLRPPQRRKADDC